MAQSLYVQIIVILCLVDTLQTYFAILYPMFELTTLSFIAALIVTMAKGIGNGFPLAAVATTTGMYHEKIMYCKAG